MNPDHPVHVDHGGIDPVVPHTPMIPSIPPILTEKRRVEMLVTSTAAGLCKELGLDTALVRAVAPVLIQNLITLERKQRDYGPHNLTKFGTFGVVVRMGDKMERIVNLMHKKRANDDAAKTAPCSPSSVFNEPIADSFLDLANYALIAYVMQQNLWPDESR